MTAILCPSFASKFIGYFDNRISVYSAHPSIAEAPELPNQPERLETAFELSLPDWWVLGKELGSEPSGELSHVAVCTPNASEMGLMLAWSRLVRECAEANETTLVICDDPWLFRHLAGIDGVEAGKAPSLWWGEFKLGLRGFVARVRRSGVLAYQALKHKGGRARYPAGAPSMMVYGHPNSSPDGKDAYFGSLMESLPTLIRVFHADTPHSYFQQYEGENRSFSLNSWGSAWQALSLMFTRWRPSSQHLNGPYGWLVRRAAAREGSTAQAMMVRWQQHCQSRWLEDTRPGAVCWPWENHAWERLLVPEARRAGCKTIGYQHSVVGRHSANQSPASNADGLDSIPDQIFCNGKAGKSQLAEWGVPTERLVDAGSFRFPQVPVIAFNPAAPVFVALPMMHPIANEMIAALGEIKIPGLVFLLKVHPMTTLEFDDSEFIKRTSEQLNVQTALRGVLYAASTVGLEALLAGLPTLRFIPQSTIAIDILSAPAVATPVTKDTLEERLKTLEKPAKITADEFFSKVDIDLWKNALTQEHRQHA